MKLFKKPIFVSISPNAEFDDVLLAAKMIVQPWKWKKGDAPREFKEKLEKYLGVKRAFLFESGRTSLYAILLALNLKENDEVLIQGFTCTAAVNPILWARAKPIYVDISPENYNMLPEDLEKKITPRSKAVIVQHTFGLAAPMDEILRIAQKHNLAVIEDVAHALGGKYQNRMLGTLGDAAIFSFGRSKIISSVSGGVAVASNKIIADNLEVFYRSCREPSAKWIARQLLHPIIFSCVKSLYNFFYLGRIIAVIANVLGLYTPSVCKSEKKGGRPPLGPSLMPNVLAMLALRQFEKIDRFNDHRRKLAVTYAIGLRKNKKLFLTKRLTENKSTFLYFPIAFENNFVADEFLRRAKTDGVHLEVWPARTVVGPQGANLNRLFYIVGSCPNAENLALRSVVLPTSPTTSNKDVFKIINLIKNYVDYQENQR